MFERYLNPAVFIRYKFLIRNTTACITRNFATLSTHHTALFTNQSSCVQLYEKKCSKLFSSPVLFTHIHQIRNESFDSNLKQEIKSAENYKELYLINEIRFFRLLSRFSKFSFYSFLLGSPLCIASSFMDIFAIEHLRIAFSVLTFYMIIFTGQSLLFSSRVVAKIMISPDKDMVKLSHLSLFGDRRDIYLKPSDIIKLHSYGPEVMSKTLVTLKLKKPSKSLIFLPGHGGATTDFEALEFIFCSPSKGDE